MHRFLIKVSGILFLVVLGIGIGMWIRMPEWTQEEAREVILTTIQHEAPASFYVTGTLDISTTIHEESRKYFVLPNLFAPFNPMRFDLGTTDVTLRVPGRISYGFDISTLTADHIQFLEDGTVLVQFPELSIFSVEPMLERAEMKTNVGWARLQSRSGQEQEMKALAQVRQALREQGDAHLHDSQQPRINTARAMRLLLTPALESIGMEEPSFRIEIGSDLVIEDPSG